MNRLGKTFHVDFKTKEYYTQSREYKDSSVELDRLFKEAYKVDSVEARWLFDNLYHGDNSEEFTIDSLKGLIIENRGRNEKTR